MSEMFKVPKFVLKNAHFWIIKILPISKKIKNNKRVSSIGINKISSFLYENL